MNNENINKLIESIKTNRFDYRSVTYCVGGHVARLFEEKASDDPIEQIIEYIGCTRNQARYIYYAGDTNLETATRGDAVRLLEALRD